MKVLAIAALLATVSALPNPRGGRIFGGEKAADGEFPFMVSLQNDQTAAHHCGGSIISPTCVLSSASCRMKVGPAHFAVAGLTNLWTRQYEQRRRIIAEELHPKYRTQGGERAQYDIALFFLNSPFDLGSRVALIYLPPVQGVETPSGPATTFGWGVDETFEMSIDLRKLSTTIPTRFECRAAIYDIIGSYEFVNEQICTLGKPEGGHSICRYDTGSPLARFEDGKWVQYGIASFGTGCGSPRGPSIYTQVSHFVDWIKDIAGVGGEFDEQ